MRGFRTISEYAGAYEAGRTHWCSFRKAPSQASIAGWWSDLSMVAGNPKANFYASTPLTSAVLDGFDGIFHGADKSPSSMHLASWGITTPTAGFVGRFTMCDYLLYYPFIDGDETSTQTLTNTVSLPRYTDGEGVMVMAVCVAPTLGGGAFTFDYINQAGLPKTSPVQTLSLTAANIGSIATSQPATTGNGPFCKLASGDTGVRSITAVNVSTPGGGLICLVLVKPLSDLMIWEINTMSEIEYVSKRIGAPQIYDGAYLNLICNTPATIAAGLMTGYASFVWSDPNAF